MTLKLRAVVDWARQPRNRWLVLGGVATLALVLLMVLSLTGRFSSAAETRRGTVAAYIDEVNATQREFGVERQTVSNIYGRARTNPRGLAGNVAALDRAALTLRRFDRRIRAIDAPPDARRLHRKLIALTAAEAAFAADIARLSRFLTVLSIERRDLSKASQSLRTDLAGAANVGAQASSFERFSIALAALVAQVRQGPVPAPLLPMKNQELARITALADSAHAIAVSLRAGSAKNTAAFARKFSVAAAGGGNAVERASITTFDSQARTIDELRTGVATEQTRLERTLP
jgi:hypothetical protein